MSVVSVLVRDQATHFDAPDRYFDYQAFDNLVEPARRQLVETYATASRPHELVDQTEGYVQALGAAAGQLRVWPRPGLDFSGNVAPMVSNNPLRLQPDLVVLGIAELITYEGVRRFDLLEELYSRETGVRHWQRHGGFKRGPLELHRRHSRQELPGMQPGDPAAEQMRLYIGGLVAEAAATADCDELPIEPLVVQCISTLDPTGRTEYERKLLLTAIAQQQGRAGGLQLRLQLLSSDVSGLVSKLVTRPTWL